MKGHLLAWYLRAVTGTPTWPLPNDIGLLLLSVQTRVKVHAPRFRVSSRLSKRLNSRSRREAVVLVFYVSGGQASPPRYLTRSVLLLCLNGGGHWVHPRIHRRGMPFDSSREGTLKLTPRMKGSLTALIPSYRPDFDATDACTQVRYYCAERKYTLSAPNIKISPAILRRFRSAHLSMPLSIHDPPTAPMPSFAAAFPPFLRHAGQIPMRFVSAIQRTIRRPPSPWRRCHRLRPPRLVLDRCAPMSAQVVLLRRMRFEEPDFVYNGEASAVLLYSTLASSYERSIPFVQPSIAAAGV
ncbi:hypothetical protein R3P38DRAFT_3177642 [Favolaschia claudopus]|uniref:Uncharacterized protein n=1 Tax=Favolaschia claudopus TaxID=2862362 RepID=A0AAW0CZJ6_9AGAR